jgi:hypothetical protein
MKLIMQHGTSPQHGKRRPAVHQTKFNPVAQSRQMLKTSIKAVLICPAEGQSAAIKSGFRKLTWH